MLRYSAGCTVVLNSGHKVKIEKACYLSKSYIVKGESGTLFKIWDDNINVYETNKHRNNALVDALLSHVTFTTPEPLKPRKDPFNEAREVFLENHSDVYDVWRSEKKGKIRTSIKLHSGHRAYVECYHEDTPNDYVAIYEAYIKARNKKYKVWLPDSRNDKVIMMSNPSKQSPWVYNNFVK